MNEKKITCRSCKHYHNTPTGMFPTEICYKNYNENFDEICNDYDLPLTIKIKNKIRSII